MKEDIYSTIDLMLPLSVKLVSYAYPIPAPTVGEVGILHYTGGRQSDCMSISCAAGTLIPMDIHSFCYVVVIVICFIFEYMCLVACYHSEH